MADAQRIGIDEIIRHFEELEDPRSEINLRHPLLSVVVIALLAVLAGGGGPTAIAQWAVLKQEFLLQVLDLPNGIPSKDVFRRVLMALKPAAFQACFANWLQSLRAQATAATGVEQPILAVDGKTARRSHDRTNGLGALHSVSVWASEFGLSLGQVACAEKSNEIRHCSKDTGSFGSCRPRLVKGLGRLGPVSGLSLPQQVQRQPALNCPPCPHSVHRLLHLAVPTVAALHGIRSRSQELLVQEQQRLLQTRCEQLLQHLAQPDKTPQSHPQLGQLGQGRGRPAPPVEQAIDLLHQPPQRAELGLTAGDSRHGLPLGGREMVLDEGLFRF